MSLGVKYPSDIFGVPLILGRNDATQIIDAIGKLWALQASTAVGDLEEDMTWLFSVLFNPRTTGARLRRLLDRLPETPSVRVRFLNPPLVIRTGSSVIVTPEGRAIYELLCRLLQESSDDPIGVDSVDSLSVTYLVYEGYRSVGISRLSDVVKLLGGHAEGLRLASIGLLLFVLVNGSSSRDTAIYRPFEVDERQRLDASVSQAVAAFADSLSPRARDRTHFSLYSGYAVTEARRRLGFILGPSPEEIYISQDHRPKVVAMVARELRRQRRSPPTPRVLTAFDELVKAYREERPTLASLGVSHENRIGTARLRDQLERALADA